jgi:bifunctional DNase/RNase
MLGVSVTRVEVTELREGTYFALLILERTGVAFEVDARPSDALAIAVRVGAPIFVAPEVLEHSGLRDEFDATGGAQA